MAVYNVIIYPYYTLRLITISENHYTDPLPPPKDITWERITSDIINLQWSPVNSICSSVKYNVQTSNCGTCPNTTAYPTVSCKNATESNISECRVSVQTVVCGNIGKWSKQVALREAGKYLTS